MKDPEPERAEIDVPDRVVDLLETDVFPAENVTDVDPVGTPADAAVETDAPHFEVSGVVQRRHPLRQWPG